MTGLLIGFMDCSSEFVFPDQF